MPETRWDILIRTLSVTAIKSSYVTPTPTPSGNTIRQAFYMEFQTASKKTVYVTVLPEPDNRELMGVTGDSDNWHQMLFIFVITELY